MSQRTPLTMDQLQSMVRRGDTTRARRACEQFVASKTARSRDLLVLSDICRALGHPEDSLHYRKVAYQIEMSRLGLSDQSCDHATDFCLASDGKAPVASPPEDYVRALFDRYSDSFDDRLVNELEYRGPAEVLRVVSDCFGSQLKELSILDAGCGTGLAGPLFRPHARQLDGFDLSPKMIDRARERQVYDQLWVGEFTDSVGARAGSYDLILSIDVFLYFSDLRDAFRVVESALGSDQRFVATFEECEHGLALGNHRRFTHSVDYVRDVAEASGLRVVHIERCSLRAERGRPLPFFIALFSKRSSRP